MKSSTSWGVIIPPSNLRNTRLYARVDEFLNWHLFKAQKKTLPRLIFELSFIHDGFFFTRMARDTAAWHDEIIFFNIKCCPNWDTDRDNVIGLVVYGFSATDWIVASGIWWFSTKTELWHHKAALSIVCSYSFEMLRIYLDEICILLQNWVLLTQHRFQDRKSVV